MQDQITGGVRTAVEHGTAARSAVAGAACLVVAAAGLLPSATTAGAATGNPIAYTLRATASGALDGVTFTNALVTMTQVSNTADVVGQGSGEPQNRTGTVTVTVAGVGRDVLTYGTSFVNQRDVTDNSADFGFNGSDSFVFSVADKSLASYALDRPFGPVSGPTYRFHRGAPTSRGSIYLSSAGTGTFRANVPRRS